MAEEKNINASNVTTGKPAINGAIFVAPKNTPLPTDATSQLNSAFMSLGYISSDGVTNSNSPSTDTVTAWGGDSVAEMRGSKPDTFKYKMLEALNINVLKFIYGEENVQGTLETGITIHANNEEQDDVVVVIDQIHKGNIARRIVIPLAAITAIDDIVYVDTGAVGYGVTIQGKPAKIGNKVDTHVEYMIKKTT